MPRVVDTGQTMSNEEGQQAVAPGGRLHHNKNTLINTTDKHHTRSPDHGLECFFQRHQWKRTRRIAGALSIVSQQVLIPTRLPHRSLSSCYWMGSVNLIILWCSDWCTDVERLQ